MTKQDFDLILIESFMHETKQSYFKSKRKEFDCLPDEYQAGLLDAFQRLIEETNKKDYSKAIVIMPDGEEREYQVSTQNHSERILYLNTIGKVSFPFKKLLNNYEYTNGKFQGSLSTGSISELWPELHKYLQSIIEKENDIKRQLRALNIKTKKELLDLEYKRLQNEVNSKLIQSLPEDDKDYSGLLKALSKYICDINGIEFTKIIEYYSLSTGTPKAKWIGSKADAFRFADYLEMKVKDFNKCFFFEDGKKLSHNNKDKDETDSPINEILKMYLNK